MQGYRGFDTGSEMIWNTINKGVRKNEGTWVACANAMAATMEGHQAAVPGAGRRRRVRVCRCEANIAFGDSVVVIEGGQYSGHILKLPISRTVEDRTLNIGHACT
jgi:hypothetical protein